MRTYQKLYKVEVIVRWTGFGGYVIWTLRVMLFLKTGCLLLLFYHTRVKEREINVRIIEVLAS